MIRLANENDINDILVLLHEVHDIHAMKRPDIFKNNTTKYQKKDIIEILKDENKPIFVFADQEKVVGYAFCIVKDIKNDNNLQDYRYIFIDDLCVEEEYRNKFIGTELYNHVKQYAKAKNAKSIRLNVWNLNEKALNFYQKNGMEILEYVMEEKLEK